MSDSQAGSPHESRPLGFPETRWSLIGRLADQPGQAALVLDLYADGIARYLERKFPDEAGRGELEDVIQEVMVWMLEHPDLLAMARPAEGSRFRYLLMTLAHNAARNAVRGQWRRRHREQAGGNDLDGGETTMPEVSDPGLVDAVPHEDLRSMDRAWAESLIALAWADVRGWAADGTLEAEVPRLLEGHLIQGLNLRDLAQELGLPLATCHRRLARGRTWLQKAIVDRLRQAGELSAGADQAEACDLLLAVITG